MDASEQITQNKYFYIYFRN